MNLRWLLIPILSGLICVAAQSAFAQNSCYESCYTMCDIYQQGQCVTYKRTCEQKCRSARSFGAIAYSEISEPAWSKGWPSQAKAEQDAMSRCGQSDCKIAIWFYDTCAALAKGDNNGPWGWDRNDNEQRAQQAALAQCAKHGGRNCQIKVSTCSP